MANRRSKRFLVFAVAIPVLVFIVGPAVAWLINVWIDYLWFIDVGQRQVFLTRIGSQLATGALFSAVAFVLLYANMWIARRVAPRVISVELPPDTPEQFAIFLERLRGGMGSVVGRVIFWGALVLAFFSGLGMASEWHTFRLALAAVPFGYTDPQFGKDVGFFIFRLPAYNVIADWAMSMLVLTLVATLLVHFANGAIQPWARLKGFAPHVKAHVSVLLALVVSVWGLQYWIDIYELNYSQTGQIIGAGYTDVHAQIPAYWILIGVSAITAVTLLLNIWFKGWRLPIISIGVWVVASIGFGAVWPAIMQALIVAPNELQKEKPYIERNIAMTRKAFGLNDVKGKGFPADETLTMKDVTKDPQTLDNVRLWDPSVAKQTYAQLQSIRSYYTFHDTDIDRYVIDGQERQVLISAREMDSSLLPSESRSWQNRHLVYTHGYGVVMSPVNATGSKGLPRFVIGDIPPTSTVGIEVTRPQIYFGEETDDYVIVETDADEFDYPQGEKNIYLEHYDGKAGIPVGGLIQRLAWGIQLWSHEIVFSGFVHPTSRVLIRRDLTSRLSALAPWLSYEKDPYPVLVDGRIVWVIDAYTTSNSFPYSEGMPDEPSITYIRNSVKVTVDAFDGTTTFYAFDPTDPVLQAWREVFPTLVVDGKKIPQEVRDHFRYPEGIFWAQAEVYRTYHMTDPRVFYNKEDQWEIPGAREGDPMVPFYVLMKLPGEKKEHFYIMQPYTPRKRDNMIGWVAANSDPEHYGDRTVYQFPKDRVVFGPQQVSARIDQDAVISPQLSLWNQRGSQTILGNMLVLPIHDSIVYIQPLYLQAEKAAIPQLTRVIVVYADKIEMESTLEGALMKVFGEAGSSAASEAKKTGARDSKDATSTPPPASTGDDAALAAKLYSEALTAQRAGDWATYGAKIDELGKVLERMSAGSGSKN